MSTVELDRFSLDVTDRYQVIIRGSSRGWTNFKIESVSPSRSKSEKRNWWLAWNGERLAKNRDAELLEAHRPEIAAAVVAEMSRRFPC